MIAILRIFGSTLTTHSTCGLQFSSVFEISNVSAAHRTTEEAVVATDYTVKRTRWFPLSRLTGCHQEGRAASQCGNGGTTPTPPAAHWSLVVVGGGSLTPRARSTPHCGRCPASQPA
jgi:hypothetical protein